MRGFDIKQIRMRAFQISGLTAKWGIGDSRTPPIWDANLLGYWDARTFPDGDLATIPNTATMEGKAPDLTVSGATMASGTLQFDGVDDYATADAYMFPDRFTVFWDVDWLGTENSQAGIVHVNNLYLYNYVAEGSLSCRVKLGGSWTYIPNTNVGISTAGKYYSKSGAAANFTDTIGTGAHVGKLHIGRDSVNKVFTRMGFRQLLIFNKELSQAEVNDVLRVMFPA
nr:MAG: pentaxin family [Bacteriophage sp.]